jgi:hypothetical protein
MLLICQVLKRLNREIIRRHPIGPGEAGPLWMDQSRGSQFGSCLVTMNRYNPTLLIKRPKESAVNRRLGIRSAAELWRRPRAGTLFQSAPTAGEMLDDLVHFFRQIRSIARPRIAAG